MKASENKFSGKQYKILEMITKCVKILAFCYQCSLVTLAHVHGATATSAQQTSFNVGSWKVLEKSLNFWPEKVYEPCTRV